MPRKYNEDITGNRYGRLTAICRDYNTRTKWWFLCQCGTEKSIDKYSVTGGDCISCGCFCSEYMREQVVLRGLTKQFGSDNPNYVGDVGRDPTRQRQWLMKQQPYADWRSAVFERDDYTCQVCGKRGGTLNADHILSWHKHPNLRYEVDNGRTLCIDCHRLTPNYGTKARYVE